MITLYDYYRSTASYRVRIALNLKGLEYNTVVVNLVKDGGEQHASAYRNLNPQQLVPLIQDSETNISLSQSLAIIEYLDEQYPSSPLLPKTPIERGQTRQIAQMIACDIHPLNNLRVLQYLKQELKQSDETKMQWYHHWLKLGFDAIEAILNKNLMSGPYCMGEAVSLADICVVAQLYNARRFEFPLAEYPLLQKIESACQELAAFANAHPDKQTD